MCKLLDLIQVKKCSFVTVLKLIEPQTSAWAYTSKA